MIEQNTQEWLEYRKTRIGGSDAPVIMNVSPWKTPYKLWQQKLGLAPPDEENQWMRRGKEMEEEARRAYYEYTGNDARPAFRTCPDYDWRVASLDGFCIDGFNRRVVLEIKCPGPKDHQEALEGRIPEKYYPQVQHYLDVFAGDVLHYWSYFEGQGCLVELLPDKQYIERLLEAEKAFYRCMETLTPPSMTGQDWELRSDSEWETLSAEWLQSKSELELASEREKVAREKLVEATNGRSCKGSGVSVTRFVRKGSVQYAKIPELRGVNLDAYRKEPTEVWRCDGTNVLTGDGRAL